MHRTSLYRYTTIYLNVSLLVKYFFSIFPLTLQCTFMTSHKCAYVCGVVFGCSFGKCGKTFKGWLHTASVRVYINEEPMVFLQGSTILLYNNTRNVYTLWSKNYISRNLPHKNPYIWTQSYMFQDCSKQQNIGINLNI